MAPRQLQRVLHLQQDDDERAAAEQHHAGPGAELQQAGGRVRPRRHRPAPRVQHQHELGARLLPGRQRASCARLLNGWTISPIIKLRSGLPFTVTNGNVDANLDGKTNDRAQQIGDPHIDNPTAAQWFNTAAFVQNKVVTGVAGRRQLAAQPRSTVPGYRVVDLAVSRDFRLPRKTKLTFRAEGTNVFNIVNFGQPGDSVPSGATSTTFGVIRSANAMRRLQLGVRVTF